MNKYLANQEFDPYVVAFALRIRNEKIAFDSIGDAGVRAQFLTESDRFAKIIVCADNG